MAIAYLSLLHPKFTMLTYFFKLYFLTADCAILSGTEDEINHLPYAPTNQRCWVIHPHDSDDRKRIYFSLRDIYLPQQQIMVIT